VVQRKIAAETTQILFITVIFLKVVMIDKIRRPIWLAGAGSSDLWELVSRGAGFSANNWKLFEHAK
jgi:hypothetical protein